MIKIVLTEDQMRHVLYSYFICDNCGEIRHKKEKCKDDICQDCVDTIDAHDYEEGEDKLGT